MKENSRRITRRNALKTSLGMVATSLCPGTISRALGFESANARPRVGVVGCGIRWDAKQERVVGDELAQSLVAREKRRGFEIEM